MPIVSSRTKRRVPSNREVLAGFRIRREAPARILFGVAANFQEASALYNEGGESVNEGASLLGAALAEQGLGRTVESINFVALLTTI
jgi:hypothetical protein